MDMAQEKMELDVELLPSSAIRNSNILRRSNSAPLINELGDNSQVFLADTLRTRRNSTTFMTQHSLEEGMDLVNKESMNECEVQTTKQVYQSWEESSNLFAQNDNNLEKPSSLNSTDLIPVSSTASPTRGIRKQCFSPLFQTCMNCTSLLASSSPRPTQHFPISQSSINAIKPNTLGSLKRKGEMVSDVQPKRFFQGTINVFSSDTTQLYDRNGCLTICSDVLDENNNSIGSSCNSPDKIRTVTNSYVA